MDCEQAGTLSAGALKLHESEKNSAQTRVDLSRADMIGRDPYRSVPADICHSSNPRRIGYIRVSTREQVTDRQVLRLEADCDMLRIEYLSAVAADRPVFDQLIDELCPGDVMVVVDLDRAFRSSIDAMLTADLLRRRGIRLDVLSLPIDTTTAEGELFYTMVAAFANFERRIISRRTREGMEAARRRGVRLGRPGALAPETIRDAYVWMTESELPCRYVAALLGVSRLTLQRGFHRMGLTYPVPVSLR